jgi:hypothetical protein
MSSTSEKALRRAELRAQRELAAIAAEGDPGRGLRLDEAKAARDAQITRAHEARAARETARAELANHEQEKRSLWDRMFAAEATNKRRRDGTPTEFEQARRKFHDELGAANAARNAAEHERQRQQGLVWEPVGPAGGVEVAAVFSSSVAWDATANEIRDGVLHEPSLHLRDLAHLWWTLNAIEAGGGSVTIPSGPGRMPPRWPAYDREAIDGILYREDSVSHLAKLGYLTIERGDGTLTLSHGPRTRALTATFRKS